MLVFKLMAGKESFLTKNAKLLWVPVLAILATCAYGTWKRNNVWHSEESLWLNVTIKSPKNGRGLMNYGNILVSEGKYADAESYFNRAQQLLPNYSFIYINMGVLKDKQGKFKDAESYFIQGILLGPQYAVHHKLYGKFLYDMRRYREAEVELERSLNLSAGDLETHQYLLQTFDALGEWDNLKLLAKGTLQLEPGNSEALAYLEDAAKQKNKADLEAEKAELSPTPEKYLQLSLDYYLDARFGLCIAAAQEAIKLKPNYAAAYNNIGSAYIALGQFDQALGPLKKALSIQPNYVLAKNNLSLAENHITGLAYPVKPPTAEEYVNQSLTYYNFKLYDLCIVACECALEQKPDYDLAYNNLCAAYNALGQWDNAIKTGEKGLQINPQNQLLKNNLAQARAGKAKGGK